MLAASLLLFLPSLDHHALLLPADDGGGDRGMAVAAGGSTVTEGTSSARPLSCPLPTGRRTLMVVEAKAEVFGPSHQSS